MALAADRISIPEKKTVVVSLIERMVRTRRTHCTAHAQGVLDGSRSSAYLAYRRCMAAYGINMNPTCADRDESIGLVWRNPSRGSREEQKIKIKPVISRIA